MSHPSIDLDLIRVLPLTAKGQSYELLDLGLKPIGRYPVQIHALDEIARHPRRTVFVLKLWLTEEGRMRVARRWLVSLGLDGQYRWTRTNKHWTIRPLDA